MQAELVCQRDTDVDRGRGVVTTARRRAKSFATLAERLAEEQAAVILVPRIEASRAVLH